MEISLFQIRAAPSREWGLDKGVQLARPPGRETALLTSSLGLLGWSEPETFEIADDVQNRGARFTAAPPAPRYQMHSVGGSPRSLHLHVAGDVWSSPAQQNFPGHCRRSPSGPLELVTPSHMWLLPTCCAWSAPGQLGRLFNLKSFRFK